MASLFSQLDPGVPVIHFGTGTATLLELQRDSGGAVIGLDWRVELDSAWRRLGDSVAVQGNLDPVVLLSSREEIEHQTRRILGQAALRPGHIFNLGHGIMQETEVDNVRYLVDLVHELSRRKPF
jgi:uroporphyrinogen decarboxylase